MLTIFASVGKGFEDKHIAMIQTNAIRSWTCLKPRPEILVAPGCNEDRQRITELGGKPLPCPRKDEFGTPLVDDLFRLGEAHARHDYVCYVNSDIILFQDFMIAFQTLTRHMQRFLMIGRRFNWSRPTAINFASNWQRLLLPGIKREGSWHNPSATDYWIYRKGLYSHIPPFALGCYAWDNWLVLKARQSVPVVDATGMVFAVHQAHPELLGPAERQGRGSHPQRVRNLDLGSDLVSLERGAPVGGPGGADYILTEEGPRRR